MSLYSTGFFIRRGTLLVLIFFGILFSIGIIGTITKKLTSNIEKVQPELYTAQFGNITPPQISSISQSSKFNFNNISLDTPNGAFPDFSAKFSATSDFNGLVNIYKIDYPEILNESRERGLTTANALGFLDKPTITDKDLHYQWGDGKRTLFYNVDTKTFEMLTSNITTVDTPLQEYGDKNTAIGYVQSLFSDIKVDVTDNLSYYKADYVKYDYNGTNWVITNATDDKPSNFIRVSYMRYSRTKGKDALPDFLNPTTPDETLVKEYYQSVDYSPVYVILKNSKTLKPGDITEISFFKYNYDITRPQTYPVKTVTEAYSELKNKTASLVKISDSDDQPISDDVLSKVKSDLNVKSIDIGYYLSSVKTGYALPVYVFNCEFVISTQGTIQTKGKAVYYVYAYKNPS